MSFLLCQQKVETCKKNHTFADKTNYYRHKKLCRDLLPSVYS